MRGGGREGSCPRLKTLTKFSDQNVLIFDIIIPISVLTSKIFPSFQAKTATLSSYKTVKKGYPLGTPPPKAFLVGSQC